MDFARKTLLAAAVLAIAMTGCTTNTCDELAVISGWCPDPVVRNALQQVVKNGDQDLCREYRDAWQFTYLPRCAAYEGDAGPDGSSDAGTDGQIDAAPEDSGGDSGSDTGTDAGMPPDGGPQGDL
ncbi:MAG: hypothetical protein WC889_20520 [Myxococcota bacterium]|jgi:hypothetical protein